MNALFEYMQELYWLFGTIWLVVGLIFCFLGRYLLKVVIFIITAFITLAVLMAISYTTFLEGNTAAGPFWGCFVGYTILGLLVGYLCTKLMKIAGAALAGWGGWVLGVVINTIWLSMYGSPALYYSINVILAIIMAILAFVMFDIVMIASTAFIGSFFVMVAASLYAGQFGYAAQLAYLFEQGAVTSINPLVYAYLGGLIILFIVGFIVQYCMFKKLAHKDKAYEVQDQYKHPYYDRLNTPTVVVEANGQEVVYSANNMA